LHTYAEVFSEVSRCEKGPGDRVGRDETIRCARVEMAHGRVTCVVGVQALENEPHRMTNGTGATNTAWPSTP